MWVEQVKQQWHTTIKVQVCFYQRLNTIKTLHEFKTKFIFVLNPKFMDIITLALHQTKTHFSSESLIYADTFLKKL